MAKVCAICGKRRQVGIKMSHSHKRNKRAWKPNLQRVKILIDGKTPRRVNVCTRCLRSGKVQRAL